MIHPTVQRSTIKLMLSTLLLLLFACSESEAPVESAANNTVVSAAAVSSIPGVSFADDVLPILEAKCVACHSCYDAPCQLNLGSASAVIRGANKKPVYDSTRIEAATPTRIGIDAQDEAGWRALGFYSVTESQANSPSLLLSMLQLGRQFPTSENEPLVQDIKLGIKRDNQCPGRAEFPDFAKSYPHAGMPYAVTGITNAEFQTISSWLGEGAALKPASFKPGDNEQKRIDQWEQFFNRGSKREQLVARYLYEHLFIAHLYFNSEENPNFYKLVRSSTAPGEPLQPIPSARPNHDPGGAFWYRLMPVEEAIVYKTHITYALSEERLARYLELFLSEDWQVDNLPGYGLAERSNPFTTFAPIPSKSRYQFMLDDASYFVRSFIRGPVCHGQIATDVIRDRFWNLFQSPESDLYVTNKAYRDAVSPLLAVPGVEDELDDFLPQWLDYRSRNKQYLVQRQKAYLRLRPDGAAIGDIWDGDDSKPDALQTIFRHHDNAAIRNGLIGKTPDTIWVMDYALFERSFYVLVANFNVFGNLPHQTLTRMYFDLIRNGAEQNFLRFMPAAQRQPLIDSWYQNSAQLKLYISYDSVDTGQPSAVTYQGSHPMDEFSAMILKAMPDLVTAEKVPARFEPASAELALLQQASAATLPVILYLPDISFLRVFDPQGNRQVYSMVRDRAHSSVAFMLGESLRYQPESDRLTIYPNILGSYPNFIFNLPIDQVPEFRRAMQSVKNEQDFRSLVTTWGLRRSDPEFWNLFHDFTSFLRETNPVEAGIFDMNRYRDL